VEGTALNALIALSNARAAGVEVVLDGDNLLLQAAAEPPTHLIDALIQHKPEILRLLRQRPNEWVREDWQAYFDERAGIVEFDGCFKRCDAELSAYEDCIDHWLIMNPPAIDLDICLQCHLPLRDLPVIQVTGRSGRYGSVHEECAARWKASRRIEARRQLSWLLERIGSKRESRGDSKNEGQPLA
jgi:hypothetical protein